MIGRDTLITQRMKLIQDGKAGFMLTILIFLGLAGTTLNAQAKPVAILEYFDNPQGVEIQDAEGFHVVEVYFGLPLSEGDRIRTRASTVELRLIPNGSIVKITPHTEFRVDALQGGKSPDTNAFTLTTGKIRTIAAKKTGSKYEIKTPSAVCGVRGTDFAMEVIPGTREGVVVREGTVEFARKTGEQVSLAAGQAADVFSPLFQPIPLAPAQLEELFKDLQFEKLNPAQVPQEAP
ncbi:MAG TPA: FecR family protein, partial [Spirochaetales bacterium]|nr:FecR family protein [Spirochaetales bacterium]